MNLGEERISVENRKITQGDLHRYAWASGDYNPIHFNDQVAKKMGLPGVIAHGMLTLAFMNKAIESLVEELALQKREYFRVGAIDTRFSGMLQVDDTVSIATKFVRNTETGVQMQVFAFKNAQRDQVVCSATAFLERI